MAKKDKVNEPNGTEQDPIPDPTIEPAVVEGDNPTVVEDPVVPARAEGPKETNPDDKTYVVKHTFFGAYPMGYIMSFRDLKDLHPGFGDRDLQRALSVGALESTDAPKTKEPPPVGPEVMAATQRKIDEEAGKAATREVK